MPEGLVGSLLCGNPGTGTAFTVESVTETAEGRCSVGTQPEAVERHPEAVLHRGKIWHFVVLSDEAGVFLGMGGPADLQQTALAPILLHFLEHYRGILVVTSNRVGTFDEAFKSRTQFALQCESLTLLLCETIWWNILNPSKALDEQHTKLNNDDCYVDELARQEVDGRTIWNASTTARQLPQYQGKIYHTCISRTSSRYWKICEIIGQG